MSETFDAEWLALREGVDATCRSAGLARRLADALPARPRLLDLGAGTASMFRWLAPIVGRAQVWTLIDADGDLLARGLETTTEWASACGYTVTRPARVGGRGLLVHTPSGAWRVETTCADLVARFGDLPLGQVDAVVCNALLDLVSAAWLDRFSEALRTPMLACLSVDGRRVILPRDPFDRLVTAAFCRDQQRDKGFGPALGPRAPSRLHRLLRTSGFSVTSVISDWRIASGEPMMLQAIVSNHADVTARWYPGQRAAIAGWQDSRMRQARAGRLAFRIGHRDILALPASG